MTKLANKREVCKNMVQEASYWWIKILYFVLQLFLLYITNTKTLDGVLGLLQLLISEIGEIIDIRVIISDELLEQRGDLLLS
jgi:hypothetical protein